MYGASPLGLSPTKAPEEAWPVPYTCSSTRQAHEAKAERSERPRGPSPQGRGGKQARGKQAPGGGAEPVLGGLVHLVHQAQKRAAGYAGPQRPWENSAGLPEGAFWLPPCRAGPVPTSPLLPCGGGVGAEGSWAHAIPTLTTCNLTFFS